MDVTIGEKIKELRLKKEWTQEELGEFLNVSRSAVSSWEVGRNYPDLETVIALSDLFEIPLDYLLREDMELAKDVTKKIKMNHYYRLLLKVIGIVIILYMCFAVVLKLTENTYLTNLEKYSWQPVSLDGEGKSRVRAYELIEKEMDYYVNIPSRNIVAMPLTTSKLKMVTRKEKLVVEMTGEDDIELIISKLNDPSIPESVNLKVDKNLKVSEKAWDNIQLTSQSMTDFVAEYLEEHEADYQEMIDSSLVKLVEIKR